MEAEERAVGCVACELDEEDETGTILLLAVHSDYQNRGIGAYLFARALQEMEAAGMKLV